METKKIVNGGHCLLELIGDLDIATVDSLLSEVETIPETSTIVEVGFSGIEFVDSTGIGTLVQVMNFLRQKDIKVKFIQIPKDVFEIFDVLGIPEIIGKECFECLD